jgi:hypothetical protein
MVTAGSLGGSAADANVVVGWVVMFAMILELRS